MFFLFFFFFNDTATTEIYTLSLHDALPISIFCAPATEYLAWTRPALMPEPWRKTRTIPTPRPCGDIGFSGMAAKRSEEHTSELQSRSDLVCRLLLEKKKKNLTMLSL